MLDYDLMDSIIWTEIPFFSIDESSMTITVCIEDENLIRTKDDDVSMLYYARKIFSFPLGEGLFSYLSIPHEKLFNVIDMIKKNPDWHNRHEQDAEQCFIASLDNVYLYLLYYSTFWRGSLGMEYNTRLDRLSKEFEFALNFCCNDEFMPKLKGLSALQKYYIYCQIYVDNIHTINRHYNLSGSMFIEASSANKEINRIPRMKKDPLSENENIFFEPITEKCSITSGAAESLIDSDIILSFRYTHKELDKYLMEELFALIKLDVRVKKCALCGKYFIMKGDYATYYCDRVNEGQTVTCKRLAAIKNRKHKIQTNPILKEYERAYKRNYARLSNRKLSNEEFRLWVEEASQNRDKVSAEYEANPSEHIVADFKKYLGNK